MSQWDELQATWDELGRQDPLWAVLSTPETRGNRWQVDEFYATGRVEIEGLLARIAALGVALRTERCLDFGCGVGRLSQALADHFASVDGVDIAPSMIEQARQHNQHGERCAFHVNRSRDLSIFPDATFDLVYTRLVLMHMQPRFSKRYIAEFIRVLRPGGLAVFHVPSGRPLTRQVLYSLAMARRTAHRLLARALGRRLAPLPPGYRHLMYPVPRRAVMRVLHDAGATLLAADESDAADQLHDVIYFALKAG